MIESQLIWTAVPSKQRLRESSSSLSATEGPSGSTSVEARHRGVWSRSSAPCSPVTSSLRARPTRSVPERESSPSRRTLRDPIRSPLIIWRWRLKVDLEAHLHDIGIPCVHNLGMNVVPHDSRVGVQVPVHPKGEVFHFSTPNQPVIQVEP